MLFLCLSIPPHFALPVSLHYFAFSFFLSRNTNSLVLELERSIAEMNYRVLYLYKTGDDPTFFIKKEVCQSLDEHYFCINVLEKAIRIHDRGTMRNIV